ncbi:MAG: Tn3 family transposase [Candidatus Methanoperedens sp.]|nr:Tn3 family transposase [Candidatus Methanoperedens sp.]
MKQRWAPDELINYWTLTPEETNLINHTSKTDYNRIGCAVLLKHFQIEGKFPHRKQDIPDAVVEHITQQLKAQSTEFKRYELQERVAKRHRVQIRTFLGVRVGTVADAKTILAWLFTYDQLLEEHNIDRLKGVVYERYRELKIEPPEPKRTERLVHSAVRTADERLHKKIVERLTPETQEKLDALLNQNSPSGNISLLSNLKNEAGTATLENVLSEISKLESIRALFLPPDLFSDVSRKRILWCKQRIAVEDLSEIRRHPNPVRYTLLSAFCYQREQEITDTLIELLITLIHKIGARAKRIVEKEFIKDIRRVQGKNKLLYKVAEASVEKPDGTIKEVIYPVASEQKLRDIVQEFKSGGSYEQKVQTIMRGSYSHHYRRMVPFILKTLLFCATNETSKPILATLNLMRKYADKTMVSYPETEKVPLDNVVPADLLEAVKQGQRVNRINYELCALKVLREKLRCKEIYVKGASRYRNPDEDLPADFNAKRTEYYADLHKPLSAHEFIEIQKKEMQEALEMFDKGIPKNQTVKLITRNGKPWIKVSPLDAQPEPKNLASLKVEVGRRWNQLYLLDILKEADLRIGFTHLFKSPTLLEKLPREILQKRLLLCLFGLGTNAGIKRIASGSQTESYRDLFYIRNRFINRDGLRAAIASVANAILRERMVSIWGEATSLASDSKKFGAWDQNLMTEWHIRYRGPGIMVYWHVEKKALCIYSQIKRCSSSEVAAMIEGVLRHCTDMEVEKNYVDSHGQDETAFAFCYMLDFELLPRLKGIGRQKLYRPEAGNPKAYPNLQSILTRPINWELIQKYYDEIAKYTTALKLGTADAEAILSRFTKNKVKHPAFQAVSELGKVRKTIFLCKYLNSEILRQEIEEGLNVIENWNSANDFIWYGKGGEIAVNNKEDQETAILALHLLQICMVYINTLFVQKVLSEEDWLNRMQPEDFRGLTPLFYGHINPYGRLVLNMDERIIIE